MSKYILSTSNENKIKEFKEYFPEIEVVNGPDLKEVLGTLDEVILYKSLEAGKNILVEDTVLVINDEIKVDIKWNVDSIKEGDSLNWITSIGYNDGTNIYVSRASIKGIATKSKANKGFAFDPFFIPLELIPIYEHNGKDIIAEDSLTGLTLADLDKIGMKKFFSARINALINFKNKKFISVTNINDIIPWTGTYQNQN
jgi:inosine/xanthosine triphosphate pyrophosphatase family protein